MPGTVVSLPVFIHLLLATSLFDRCGTAAVCTGYRAAGTDKAETPTQAVWPPSLHAAFLTVKNQTDNGNENALGAGSSTLQTKEIVAVCPSLLVFGLQLESLTLPVRA